MSQTIAIIGAGYVGVPLAATFGAAGPSIVLVALQPRREPDLSIVLDATRDIAKRLKRGHLVILESTTYPGTTRESLKPILEESGLKAGEDFHLAFSPERVDPGREDWTTTSTPKIVGGLTETCTKRAVELYETALETV